MIWNVSTVIGNHLKGWIPSSIILYAHQRCVGSLDVWELKVVFHNILWLAGCGLFVPNNTKQLIWIINSLNVILSGKYASTTWWWLMFSVYYVDKKLPFLTWFILWCTSCRYLPPEIGCLSNLEYLDLSFNKMKSLPAEISNLTALVSLKVANNKLSELPMALSSLKMLENLDLSHNRLTSLGSLDLRLMCTLQNLNLQVLAKNHELGAL